MAIAANTPEPTPETAPETVEPEEARRGVVDSSVRGDVDLLDGLDLGGDDRSAVTARLRGLLRDWEHAPGATDTAPADPADPLRAATDDEMFALLDDELGRTA